jgi:hypothetical protein
MNSTRFVTLGFEQWDAKRRGKVPYRLVPSLLILRPYLPVIWHLLVMCTVWHSEMATTFSITANYIFIK